MKGSEARRRIVYKIKLRKQSFWWFWIFTTAKYIRTETRTQGQINRVGEWVPGGRTETSDWSRAKWAAHTEIQSTEAIESRDTSPVSKPKKTSAVGHQLQTQEYTKPGRTSQETRCIQTQRNGIQTQSRKQQTISRVLKYSNSQLLTPSGVKMTFQMKANILSRESFSPILKEVFWEEETRLREKQPGRRGGHRKGEQAKETQTKANLSGQLLSKKK